MKKDLFFILSLVFFSFTADQHKSTYTIPIHVHNIIVADIEQDGDQDIVTGHAQSSLTDWGGFTILENIDNHHHIIVDSFYVENGFPYIHTGYFNDNEYPDFYSTHLIAEPYTCYLSIVFDYGLYEYDSIKTFVISDQLVSKFDTGDVNGDGFNDIVVLSTHGVFWGVLYNNGQGSFSIPEYYDIEGYYPSDISCGDLNGDNRDDIIICGTHVEIYFSSDEGFDKLVLETNASEDEAIIADFDNDGDNDILTYWGHVSFGSQTFYENIEDSLIVKLNKKILSFGFDDVNIADYNNDTYQDLLFVTSDNTGYYLYQNQGDFQLADSQFIAMPCSNPVEIRRKSCSADMDGNGYMDIVTINILHKPLSNNLEIRYNDGKGNFLNNPISGINEKENKTTPLSAYPNPFSQSTKININSSFSNYSNLSIYNINGQLIKNIEKSEINNHIYHWDATDKNGKPLPSGIYFVCLKQNGKPMAQIKMIKL